MVQRGAARVGRRRAGDPDRACPRRREFHRLRPRLPPFPLHPDLAEVLAGSGFPFDGRLPDFSLAPGLHPHRLMIAPDTLEWPLRVAGAGLILLALLHIPISRELKWTEEGRRLSPMNESVFHVHTFFVCLVLVIMGLPSLLTPEALLERSLLGKWTAVSWSVFWFIRLYCQWFVY